MTVRELIEMLEDVEDKEKKVVCTIGANALSIWGIDDELHYVRSQFGDDIPEAVSIHVEFFGRDWGTDK